LLIRVLLQKLLLSELTVPCTVSGTCLPNCFTIPNPSTDVQKEFDLFYDKLLDLFNNYYPLRTITVSSRDPDYVTPAIKAKLRRKNRLIHVGRLDEADALAKQIAKDISKSTKSRLSHISLRRGTKGVWAAVRELTGRKRQVAVVDGIYCPVPSPSMITMLPYPLTHSTPSLCVNPLPHLLQIIMSQIGKFSNSLTNYAQQPLAWT